jgi:probable HAF family extracellular repeat protein
MIDLGTLGGDRGVANDINDFGDIVGYCGAATDSRDHAFLYNNGTMTDLGSLFGFDTVATSINNNGQIVGQSGISGSGGIAGLIYSEGVLNRLDDFIDPNSNWQLWSALDINDAGQIVGYGSDPAGHAAGFVLTPIPEPAWLGALLAGFALVQSGRRARMK